MIRRLAILTVFLTAIPSAALAELYIGAGLGQASFKDNVSNVDFSENTTSWKIYAGLRAMKFLGIEVSYVDLGSVDGNEGGVTWGNDTTGWDAFAVGALPIGPVELFGKIGVILAAVETDISNARVVDSEYDPAYGLGARLLLGDRLGLRAEWERFEIGTIDDLNMYGLGIELRF